MFLVVVRIEIAVFWVTYSYNPEDYNLEWSSVKRTNDKKAEQQNEDLLKTVHLPLHSGWYILTLSCYRASEGRIVCTPSTKFIA
jgi:hypothetical protein